MMELGQEATFPEITTLVTLSYPTNSNHHILFVYIYMDLKEVHFCILTVFWSSISWTL